MLPVCWNSVFYGRKRCFLSEKTLFSPCENYSSLISVSATCHLSATTSKRLCLRIFQAVGGRVADVFAKFIMYERKGSDNDEDYRIDDLSAINLIFLLFLLLFQKFFVPLQLNTARQP